MRSQERSCGSSLRKSSPTQESSANGRRGNSRTYMFHVRPFLPVFWPRNDAILHDTFVSAVSKSYLVVCSSATVDGQIYSILGYSRDVSVLRESRLPLWQPCVTDVAFHLICIGHPFLSDDKAEVWSWPNSLQSSAQNLVSFIHSTVNVVITFDGIL